MCIKRQLGHKSLGNAHPGPAEPLQRWDCTDWMDPHYPGTDARRAAALQPPGASLQTWFAPSLKRSLAGEFTHPRRIPRGQRPRLAVGVLLSWPRHFHPLSPPGLSGSDHMLAASLPRAFHTLQQHFTRVWFMTGVLEHKDNARCWVSEAAKQQTQQRGSSKVAQGQDCPSWLIHKASLKPRWRPGKRLCLGDWNFCEGQSPAASWGLLWQLPWPVLGVPCVACPPSLQSPHQGKVLPALLR